MTQGIFAKRMFYGGAAGLIVVAGIVCAVVLLSCGEPAPTGSGPGSTTSSAAGPNKSVQTAASAPTETQAAVAEAQEPPAAQENQEIRPVDVVQPRKSDHFVISVDEVASVHPYYHVDLRAKVSGDCGYIQKNINDQVRKDERLIVIQVPDLVADVNAKKAMIEQRTQEVDLAEKQWRIALAAEQVAKSAIGLSIARQNAAQAMVKYRKLELNRFSELTSQGGAVASMVEEKQRDSEAADADYQAAIEGVDKARADFAEAQANSAAAQTQIDLQTAMKDVAVRDKEKAEALLSYATITAPFDGVIVERNIDPGSFVQSGATTETPPLLSVDRVDLVTVSMDVPDTFAPYVSRGADALVQIGNLFAHGKVTRYSPSIEERNGQNMHVEVDLFNGASQADYNRFVAEHKATWPQERKGADDPFPIRPEYTGQVVSEGRYPLLPGMVARMWLFLRKFDNVFLIPSQAVFARAGRTFIAEVVGGKVKFTEVQVQADDTMLSKVLVVSYKQTANGEEPSFSELTGKELIAEDGRQLKDGELITPTVKGW
jgi:multidrug resistance efflux pump